MSKLAFSTSDRVIKAIKAKVWRASRFPLINTGGLSTQTQGCRAPNRNLAMLCF